MNNNVALSLLLTLSAAQLASLVYLLRSNRNRRGVKKRERERERDGFGQQRSDRCADSVALDEPLRAALHATALQQRFGLRPSVAFEARDACLAALLAYSARELGQPHLRSGGAVRSVAVRDAGDAHYIVLQQRTRVLLAVRGTHARRDWLANARFGFGGAATRGGVAVHGGWWARAQAIFDDLLRRGVLRRLAGGRRAPALAADERDGDGADADVRDAPATVDDSGDADTAIVDDGDGAREKYVCECELQNDFCTGATLSHICTMQTVG